MQNIPTTVEILNDLNALLAKLQAKDASTIDSSQLARLATAIKDVCSYAPAVHGQIELRAIGNGEMLPGVVVKDAVTQRKWNDPATVAELVFGQFGLKAFTVNGPAAIEKLGDEGKALVSIASYKPPAGKRVVY